jgi:hypothetical protein
MCSPQSGYHRKPQPGYNGPMVAPIYRLMQANRRNIRPWSNIIEIKAYVEEIVHATTRSSGPELKAAIIVL